MGLLTFLRTVVVGTDGGRAEFTSGPVDEAIAARAASNVSTSLQAVYSATVTREFALAVPAILRGRNVICSVATLPLVTIDRRSRDRVDSALLAQIDPQVANVVTLAQTIEDLIFDGLAWWRILARGAGGYPTSAQHVESWRVSTKEPRPGARLAALNRLPSGVDPSAVIWVDGEPVDGTTFVRFDSPNPPLLVVGKRAIRRAALLDAAASMYAEDPAPREYFTPADGEEDPDDAEVQDILDAWVDARRRRASAYVPGSLVRHEVQAPTPADLQLISMQERSDLALANMLGLDPEDVGVSTTSRTYNNATDRRRDRINDTLSPYMLAITSRLSMNDVTRRAQQVTFDLTDYLKADPMTQANVAAVYLDRNVLSAQEVRADLGRPDVPVELAPVRPAVAPASAPAAQSAPAGQNSAESAPVELEDRMSIPATFSAQPATFSVEAPERPAIRCVSFDVATDGETFKVDAERRTITGLAVPFGEVTSDWRAISFAAGSVEVPSGRTVPVLMAHGGVPLGVVTSTSDAASGMTATLRLSKTVAADEALTLASDRAVTGLSIGVDIHRYETDTETEVTTVTHATLREISLTPFPAFDSARVDKVNLSLTNGAPLMSEVADHGTQPAAAAAPAVAFDADTLAQAFARALPQPAAAPVAPELPADFAAQVAAALAPQLAGVEVAQTVNPVREGDAGFAQVTEPCVYRFDGMPGEHDFSTDVFNVVRFGSGEAKSRVKKFLSENFVTSGNVSTLNPNRQRPDLWVDEKSFSTPLWDSMNKGTIADATPFVLPKFNTSSGVVADHTEATEPTTGTYTTTSQTITPAAMSGKVEITREAIDQGGNPQLSTVLWAKIGRAWDEALEAKAAAMLNGLSLTPITITTAAVDAALAKLVRAALAAQQFSRGGMRFRDLKLQVDLYTALINASDTTGRPLFPSVGGMNADGSVDAFFGALNLYGLAGMPSWALGATSVNSSNSYLYDRNDVHGWATPPIDLNLADQDVAKVYIGVFGYQATACTDTTGVKRLAYDPA